MARQLATRDATFTIRSGRDVFLKIWTHAEDLLKTAHAMYLQKAPMKCGEDASTFKKFRIFRIKI